MRLTGWLLVEVALIGLTKISLTKSSFNHRIASQAAVPELYHWGSREEGSVMVLLHNGES
jgi:hypothetical protein